jgi:hypothetical protein
MIEVIDTCLVQRAWSIVMLCSTVVALYHVHYITVVFVIMTACSLHVTICVSCLLALLLHCAALLVCITISIHICRLLLRDIYFQ